MEYRFFALFLLLAGGILYLSGIPSLKFGFSPIWEQVARKTVHIVLFAGLTALLWHSLPALNSWLWLKILICIVVGLTFAVADETRQHFVPGRRGGGWGVFFDFVGISLALLVLGVRQWRER